MTHVIFDIGGVLINYDFARLAQELAKRTGQDSDRLLPWLRFGNDRIPEIREALGLVPRPVGEVPRV